MPTPRLARDDRRFQRDIRRRHGADAWLLEWLAPLRDVRLGRTSVGEAAEVATFCLRHLREDRAPQIAAALAFRSLFGLVPVLVVVTLIAKSVLGDDFEPSMQRFFDSMGLNGVRIAVPATDPGVVTLSTIGLDQWLMQLVTHVKTLNIAALGWTGFALVALSAIWVLVTIEEAFNVIYRCQQGRSWLRRVLVYWFVLTLGPLIVGGVELLFARIEELESFVHGWWWLAALARTGVSLTIFWLVLLLGYLIIPSVRASWRPAMIGAGVGAVLLQIGKSTFGLYLEKAFGMSALYGSLGLIPLFMFWVYLMWLVILFGAEIAALLQAIRGRERDSAESLEVDAEATLRAAATVAGRFSQGATVTLSEVTRETRLPSAATARILDRLEDAGYVRRISDEDGYTLARPADTILVEDILNLAWAAADQKASGSHTAADGLERKLRDAQRTAVRGVTLAPPAIG